MVKLNNVYVICYNECDHDYDSDTGEYLYINYSSIVRLSGDEEIDWYEDIGRLRKLRSYLLDSGVVTYDCSNENVYKTFINMDYDIEYYSDNNKLSYEEYNAYCSVVNIISSGVREMKLNSIIGDE